MLNSANSMHHLVCDGCGFVNKYPADNGDVGSMMNAASREGWNLLNDKGDFCPVCVEKSEIASYSSNVPITGT